LQDPDLSPHIFGTSKAVFDAMCEGIVSHHTFITKLPVFKQSMIAKKLEL
jgi:hypothetical protein